MFTELTVMNASETHLESLIEPTFVSQLEQATRDWLENDRITYRSVQSILSGSSAAALAEQLQAASKQVQNES